MSTHQPLARAAAHNNAAWCDLVCRAHGHDAAKRCHATAFADGLWLNRSPAPPFYSNLVTTHPNFTAAQLRGIQALLDSSLPPRWSVKDSFCALDLDPLGFEILFEAQWLALPPDQPLQPLASPAPLLPRSPASPLAAAWEPVTTETGLEAWEAAWRGDDANSTAQSAPRVFRPALLDDPAIVFLAARQAGRIVGVAVLNRSDDGYYPVCGLSNLFFPDPAAEAHRPGVLAAARAAFPGLPLVGYERGGDLTAMLALGFQPLGPLRVWIRRAPVNL